MEKEKLKKDYLMANAAMEKLLLFGEENGFDSFSKKQKEDLKKFTAIVNAWEEKNVVIPYPETLRGVIELKMYEHKLKQKELAKMLNTSDTQLSEIIHSKRKPTVAFLKALNQILEIDGNLLLKLA